MNNILSSIIEFTEINGTPKVKMDLPSGLRLGERIKLKFVLRRKNGHRLEELRIDGEYKITSMVLDTTYGSKIRQLLQVESASVNGRDTWRAIKNDAFPSRKLPPARFPRTVVA